MSTMEKKKKKRKKKENNFETLKKVELNFARNKLFRNCLVRTKFTFIRWLNKIFFPNDPEGKFFTDPKTFFSLLLPTTISLIDIRTVARYPNDRLRQLFLSIRAPVISSRLLQLALRSPRNRTVPKTLLLPTRNFDRFCGASSVTGARHSQRLRCNEFARASSKDR